MKQVVRSLLSRAAGKYAAGEHLDDAIFVAKQAKVRGYGCTLCYWHVALEDPQKVAERYKVTLDRISREDIDANLAIKIPGLWERQELIDAVVKKARAMDVTVEIDSHEPEKASDVVRAAEALGPEKIVVAIPSRWSRSLEMAQWAIEQGLGVRVVKGAWPDPHRPRIDPDQGYRAVIDALAGRCREVSVATHNIELAAHSLKVLNEAGTPTVQELVYGLPMPAAADVARKSGVATRIYIPYGHAWIPYAISRAIKDPRTLYWLGRDLFTGGREPLPPPQEAKAPAPAAADS